jgi:hypothetical protein
MALFLTLLDRFKNHIFYQGKRMKKLAQYLLGTRSIMLFYLFIFAVMDCNTWRIVGFRKIISFKIGIKKLVYLQSYLKKKS